MFSISGSHPNLDSLQMNNQKNFTKISKIKRPQPPAEVGGVGGGGPAEYPAVHLKEAILIPIVLLPVIPLQACTWLEYTCMWSCWNAHGWNTHGWSTHGWNTHGWNTDGLGTSVCAHTRIVSPSHSP